MTKLRNGLLFALGVVAVAAIMVLPTAQATSINFVTDTTLTGLAARMDVFDPATSQLEFTNSKTTTVGVFDSNSVFRNAMFDKYQPSDPCKTIAESYNTAGLAGDSNGIFSAISNMATNHCHARILLDTVASHAIFGHQPIKSFRPIPTF